MHGQGAAVPGEPAGGGLDLLGSAGPHHGSGQLVHGLCQCQEPTGYNYTTQDAPHPAHCLLGLHVKNIIDVDVIHVFMY